MPRPHVNYDEIAATYDRRFTSPGQRSTASQLKALMREGHTQRVLEVGCGTAHWLAQLRQEASAQFPRSQLYGLDLSAGMLGQARYRDIPLHLAQGRAERTPFAERSFDLVYCVNAIHHFDQPDAFIAEARRLLRPGGALAVIGMDPRGHCHDWYIYHYFAGTFETDLARFPSWGLLLDWVAANNFDEVTWRLVDYIHDPKIGPAVLRDPFLDKNAASQLALLSDEAYAQGLRQIQEALAAAKTNGETLIFPSDIYIHILIARVAEG